MEQRKTQPEPNKNRRFSIFWIYPILVIALGFIFLNSMFKPEETTWPKFKKEMLLENEVEKIDIVNKETAEIHIKEESLKKEKYKNVSSQLIGKSPKPGPHYFFPIGSLEVFEQQLEAAQSNLPETSKVTITYSKRENWWSNILSWLLPLALIFFFWTFISRRISSGVTGKTNSIFDFGKTKAAEYGKGKISPITFKDVAGYDEAKTEVMEVVEFLSTPSTLQN